LQQGGIPLIKYNFAGYLQVILLNPILNSI